MKRARVMDGPSGANVSREPDWPAIGSTLRNVRESMGLSQRTFAPNCAVDRSTLQKIEAGHLIPSVDLARRIEGEFGLAPGAIFGEPHVCGRIGCDEMTFAGFCPGHGPKQSGPTLSRADRTADGPGTNLRRARIAAGLTQRELGLRVTVLLGRSLGQGTLASIENGYDRPSVDVAVALGQELGRPDLFEVGQCPCRPGCPKRTVGGAFAKGHSPATQEARSAAGRRNGQAARRLWNLFRGRKKGPTAKGRTQALEVGRAALRIIEAKPQAMQSRNGRRALIEALMLEFVCDEETVRRGTADAGYEAARAKIRRRLQRAYRELGEPVALSELI